MTQTEKALIGLAERAEAYIKREQQNQSQSHTKSNLENRRSKRNRIQQAKQKHMRN